MPGSCWTPPTAYSNAKIAHRRQVTVDTARTWRNRHAEQRMAGLTDRPRPGRPPRFTPVQVAEIKALACQLPAENGTPLSKWSCPEIAAEIIGRGICPSIAASTVRRILATDAIKPWQHQSGRLTAGHRRPSVTARTAGNAFLRSQAIHRISSDQGG